jgi:hypothetical protein
MTVFELHCEKETSFEGLNDAVSIILFLGTMCYVDDINTCNYLQRVLETPPT